MKKILIILLVFTIKICHSQNSLVKGTPLNYKRINLTRTTDSYKTKVYKKKTTRLARRSVSSNLKTLSTKGAFNVSKAGGSSYSIPIATAKGISGSTPQIAVSYSSQSGKNGVAGWGWNISGISKIHKTPKTKHLDGSYGTINKGENRYAIDGQRLLLKSGVYSKENSVYVTENKSNLKVIAYGNTNSEPSHFKVFYPSGKIISYGLGNSRNDLEWLIYKVEDTQGNSISYSYELDGNLLYISSINYGSNKITFKYKNREEKLTNYVNGVKFVNKKILNSISTYSKSKKYRQYKFLYNKNSTGYERLESVTEFNHKNEMLNPIVFSYDDTSDKTLKKNAFEIHPTSDLKLDEVRVKTGDFDDDGNSDIIFIPKGEKNKLHTLYNAGKDSYLNLIYDRKIKFDDLFVTKILNDGGKILGQDAVTLVHEESIGKVNFKSLYYMVTAGGLTVTYEKTWNAPTNKSNCNSKEDKIPKRYLKGDFNRDGLTDILAIEEDYFEYDKKYIFCKKNKSNITNRTYLIDLHRKKTTNFARQVGNIRGIKKQDILRVVDFNQDGNEDILHFSDGKLVVYGFDQHMKLKQIFYYTDNTINVQEKPILLGDFNGDGKIDYITPKSENSSIWNFRINTDKGIEAYSKDIGVDFNKNGKVGVHDIIDSVFHEGTYTANYNYTAIDFNNDGMSDIIENKTSSDLNLTMTGFPPYSPSTYVKYYENTKKGFEMVLKNNSSTYQSQIGLFVDTNGIDNKPDYVFISGSYFHSWRYEKNNSKDMLLSSIENNGVKTKVMYEQIGETIDNYAPKAYNSSYEQIYPYINFNRVPGFSIVSSVKEKSNYISREKKYEYKGLVFNVDLGFLGFEETAESEWFLDSPSKWSVQVFLMDKKGALGERIIGDSYNSHSSRPYDSKITNSYKTTIGPNKVFTNKLIKTVAENKLTGQINTKTFSYDSFDNLAQDKLSFDGGTKETNYTYYNNPNPNDKNYYMGRPKSIVSNNTLDTQFGTETQFTYQNNLLKTKKVRANGTDWKIETFLYDNFGNVIEKTLSANGAPSRTTSKKYDTTGRLVIESRDIEGMKTSYEYGDFDLVRKAKNPYGQSNTFTYDNWERVLTETNYLNIVKSFNYKVEDNNKIVLSVKTSDGLQQKTTTSITRLKLEVAKLGFSNKWIKKQYKYDKLGKQLEESDSFYTSPSVWKKKSYDKHNRIASITDFNGKTTTISYDKNTVTSSNGKKTVKTTKNGAGKTIKVEDNGGTIKYTYHGNGVMKSANYGGHVVQTEIDSWGNKTKLIDPSSGTYTYTYNNIGEITQQTTPKGSTDFTYDDTGKVITKKIKGAYRFRTLLLV